MNQIHKFTSSRLYKLVGSTPKKRIISASAFALTVCAFGAAAVAPLAPDASDLPVTSIQEAVAMPDLGKQISAL